MPVTPFHLGIGLSAKGAAPHRFSLTVFTLVQVVIDSEVLARLLLGSDYLHAHLHTVIGSTAVAVFSVIAGRPLCVRAKRWWNTHLDRRLRARLAVPESITLGAAVNGALIGAWSHVLLDSIMHPDVIPFAPFTSWNPLLNVLNLNALHLVCGIFGIAGAAALAFRYGAAMNNRRD